MSDPLVFSVEISDADLQAAAPVIDIDILREQAARLQPITEMQEVVLEELRCHLGDIGYYTGSKEDAQRIIFKQGREFMVGHLEDAGIQCYDHETDAELCEALLVNIGDGTIDASVLEEVEE